MVPGKLPVPGSPSNLYIEGQGPTVLAVGAGWGGLDIFTHVCHFSFVSPSPGDGPIKTEILSQRAVKPKTTNQPNSNRSRTQVSRPVLHQLRDGASLVNTT